jgi:hypothetical protein
VTVKRAPGYEGPPGYERAGGPTSFDPFEAQVRALLVRFPVMPASVVSEREEPHWRLFLPETTTALTIASPCHTADRNQVSRV